MDDLWTAFITARLDQDEELARLADQQAMPTEFPRETHLVYGLERAGFGTEYQGFTLVFNPARVLREVAAMRAIVALHQVHSEPERWGSSHSDPAMRGQPTGHVTYWCDECDHDRDYGHIGSRQQGCPTIRELAAIWSDHGDYPGAAVAPVTGSECDHG